MYHTIADVMDDYAEQCDAAGVPDEDRLDIDDVRQIAHKLGRYEEIDRADMIHELMYATDPELCRVLFEG
jgi:hypothetical protein